MDGGSAAELAGLGVFVAAILILHEMAHVAVARLHGYPVLCLAALTSSGDVAVMVAEFRRPVRGKDRIVRDVRLLKRMGSLIWFTGFGKSYVLREFGLSPRQFVAAASRRAGSMTAPEGS